MVDQINPYSVLLTTGMIFQVAVSQNIKHYLSKELVNLYPKPDKNHGQEPWNRGKSARTAVAMSGIEIGDGTNNLNCIVKFIVVSGQKRLN